MKLSSRPRIGYASLAVLVGGLAGWHARSVGAAGIPASNPFTYGGVVTDAAGAPVRNTPVSVTMYDAATGGTQLCTGTGTAMTGLDGRFSIPLASGCTSAFEQSTSLFAQVFVNGVPIGARTSIGAVPYAAQAVYAESVTGPVDVNQIVTPAGTFVSQVAAPGTIVETAAPTCPAGTVAADGSSLSRTGQFANLFAALGTTYGSVDGSHFTLPDARGVFVRGAGSQTINGLTYTGVEGQTRNDTTKKNGLGVSAQPHQHISNNGGAGNSGPYGTAGFSGGLGNFTAQVLNIGSITSPTTVSVSLSGGDAETAPAHISVLYCIRY